MSTLNKIQNNYMILSISTTNNTIKTIVIQNPWRLYLHCGNPINWKKLKTTRIFKLTTPRNWIFKKNRLVQSSWSLESKLTRITGQIPSITTYCDWPIRLKKIERIPVWKLIFWDRSLNCARVCAKCKCFNFDNIFVT